MQVATYFCNVSIYSFSDEYFKCDMQKFHKHCQISFSICTRNVEKLNELREL